MGGVLASPVVKAVLDALGVSYVVEQGSDEYGNWWRRYNNGWVEQGGCGNGGAPSTQIVFLIEFADTNYYENYIGERPGSNPYDNVYLHTVQDKTTTGFTIKDYMVTNQPFVWEAKGFAA